MKKNKHTFDESLAAFKDARLTAEARERIRGKVISYARAHGPVNMPAVSPYFTFRNFSYKSLALTFILIFSVSGGTAFAAESSLPGDVLYPLKTHVIEPVVQFTKITPNAKAQYELSLADIRIKEMQKLEQEGRATPSTREENQALFRVHIEAYQGYVLKTRGATQADVEINIKLREDQYEKTVAPKTEHDPVIRGSVNGLLEPLMPVATSSPRPSKAQDTDSKNKSIQEKLPTLVPESITPEAAGRGDLKKETSLEAELPLLDIPEGGVKPSLHL